MPATGKEPNIVPVSEEAAFIRLAFDLLADTSATQAEVLDQLNRTGFRTRKGKPVTMQTFGAIIRNPIYRGLIHLKKFGITTLGNFEPIVPAEVFERVQSRLSAKGVMRANHKRNHPDFPLRVFVTCSVCGTGITGSFSTGKRGGKYGYYSCRTRGCKGVSLRKDQLERQFMALLQGLQLKPQYEKALTAIIQDIWKNRRALVEQQSRTASQHLDDLKFRRIQLTDALMDGRIRQDIYDERIDTLDQEITLAQFQLSDCQEDELEIEAVLAFAKDVFQNTAILWLDAPLAAKLQFQQMLFPEGISYSIVDGFGTRLTSLFFNELGLISSAESSLASPTGFEPVLSP